MNLQQHPLSAAFPAMPDAELGALVLDIEAHGQREPGVLYEGMVLDGWHRYVACEKAGLEFRAVEFSDGDPRAFVKSKNLHRRHLTGTQRAQAVVAVNEWAPTGRPGKGEVASPFPEKGFSTVAEMAQEAEVSQRTIQQVKKANGVDPKLGDAMRDGVINAERASEISDLPKARRAKAIVEPKEKKPRVIVAERKFEKLYEAVKAELVETKEALVEMKTLAESAKAFEEQDEFKQMQILRLELQGAKRRRDELMRENAEMKKQIAYWEKRALKAEKK